MRKGFAGFAALAVLTAGILAAAGVLSQLEKVTAFSVSPSVVHPGQPFAANVSVWAGGYREYVAVYARLNASNASWAMRCSWPGTYINGTRNFSCLTSLNQTGNYTVRATIHTNTRPGCDNVTYTPTPFDGCGDYKDRTLVVANR